MFELKLKRWSFVALMALLVLALLAAIVWAATSLTSTVSVKATSRMVNSLDLSSAVDLATLDASLNFTSGTGNNQTSVIYHDTRTLADGATENLDLAGVLTNPFGSTVTFTKVKVIVFKNMSATQTFSLGGAASAQFVNWVGDATDIINVPPGGCFVISAPLAGFAVTATSADLLKVANSAGAEADYKIMILGN